MYSLVNLVMCFPLNWSLITLFMLHVFLIIRSSIIFKSGQFSMGFVHLNENCLLINVFLQPNLHACLSMTLLYFTAKRLTHKNEQNVIKSVS